MFSRTYSYIDETRFDETIDPKQMVGHGVAGSGRSGSSALALGSSLDREYAPRP
jgi:hypothetical protein